MTVTLIIPSGINVVAYVNETLVSARRRGFDGEMTLPSLRQRAKAVVFEATVLRLEATLTEVAVGEFKP